jgi:hypothetical protein
MVTVILSFILLLETIGGVFFFSRGNRRKKEEEEDEAHYKNNLLCRFVLDGLGKKIGESVAIEEDILIVKSRAKYLGIPMKHIEEEEKTLLVKGLVDREKAELMGEKWRQESLQFIDHGEGEE